MAEILRFLRPFATSLIILCLQTGMSYGVQDRGRVLRTTIAQGLSISTDISTVTPRVGQQFSIVYSLVAQRYPTAVDVQPQQFTGLWTEVVPLPLETRTITRLVDGKPTHEFLLRQVIAYAIREGELLIPPLAVKIMLTSVLAPGATDWDLEAVSQPVTIHVLRLSANTEGNRRPPLVGTMEGRLKPAERRGVMEAVLEIQGTANISFMQPLDWLRVHGATLLPPRLLQAESVVDTMDTAGHRKLTLTMRRFWAVKLISPVSGTVRIDEIRIPVYQPDSGEWLETHIEGASFANPPGLATGDPTTVGGSTRPHKSFSTLLRQYGVPIAGILAAFTGAGAAFWILYFRRAKHSPEHWMVHGLAKLERQSLRAPRSFLETAHRFLERYASENHLRHSAGGEEGPFDQCWSEIERCRFNGGEPPAEKRHEILRLMQTMLKGEAAGSRNDNRP